MTVPQLDYRSMFFETIVVERLGYNPRIEIKPVHLANGFFRAICGGYVNNEALHMAAFPKGYTVLDGERAGPHDIISRRWSRLSIKQQQTLRLLERRDADRGMLFALLSADKALFNSVNTSSYSLSHASHITNDNHDRDTGQWLATILGTRAPHPAYDLMKELLEQNERERNDEISILTLPLDGPPNTEPRRPRPYPIPSSLAMDDEGHFQDPLIRSIRAAFDQLAENDAQSARGSGKLDTLRRFVSLGCFAVYLHLANAHSQPGRTPMIFRFTRPLPSLTVASARSYKRMLDSIDSFLYEEILATLRTIEQKGDYGSWDTDTAIQNHIDTTITWKRGTRERISERFPQDCLYFYQAYRNETSGADPIEALARALRDMLGAVLSATPHDVARGLGTRIGLLNPFAERQRKTYDPHPDFLEVLIRASVPRGQTWSLSQLAQHWADSFGILCGVLGDENQRLELYGITVDQGEWFLNAEALAEALELSGYARRYADGVVLVTVGE